VSETLLFANGVMPDWMKFTFLVMLLLAGSFYAVCMWYLRD